MTEPAATPSPLGLFIQPACLQHKYIRHPNSSHIFERPERLRAVLLGVAAAVARLEEAEERVRATLQAQGGLAGNGNGNGATNGDGDDLSNLLSGLSIQSAFQSPRHLSIVPPPTASSPGQVLLHHPALQLAHSPPSPALLDGQAIPSSTYLRDLHKWASEAIETIKQTGCEIPSGLGLNQGDLYLAPGSVLAIEGAVSRAAAQSVRQLAMGQLTFVDPDCLPSRRPGLYVQASSACAGEARTFNTARARSDDPVARPQTFQQGFLCDQTTWTSLWRGHSIWVSRNLPRFPMPGPLILCSFCYVNNVVVGALHGTSLSTIYSLRDSRMTIKPIFGMM